MDYRVSLLRTALKDDVEAYVVWIILVWMT